MVLEYSLTPISQTRPNVPLEYSPAFSMYLIACQVEDKSPGTISTYTQRVGRFLKFIEKPEADVTRDDVRRFLLQLKQDGIGQSTRNAYYRAVKTYFRWLGEGGEGIIQTDPFKNVNAPPLPKLKPQPFTHDDMRRLILETSRDRFLDYRNRAIVLVATDTGLRLKELAGIMLADVDFNCESIRVIGKGNKERYVRIGKATQKAVLRYLIQRTDQHQCLWVTEERRPMKRRGISIMLKRLFRRAGVKGHTHMFRNTAAMECLRNGMGEFNLQNMLGHSTLAMTRRYVEALNADDMFRAHRQASPVDNLKL